MIIEVLPHVWIGSCKMTEDSNFILDKNIKAIINLEKDLSFLDRKCEYNDIVRQNVEKYDIIKLSQYLKSATTFIYEKLQKSEGVLVVCRKGIIKSPLIILAYLIKYGSLPIQIAINMIHTKIPLAFSESIYGEKGLNYFIQNL